MKNIIESSRDRPKSASYPMLKNSKGLPRINLQYSKIEKAKKWTEWRAKRGTLPKLSSFLSQLNWDLLEKKQNFRKKVSQCRKTEKWEPLGFFNIHSVAKHQKIEGEIFIFGKKI